MRAQLTQALLVSCFITIGHSVANAQTTWYVDDDNCPGLGLGTLADPFCAIQDGMNAAVDGDEVLVSPGTYFEAINFLGKAIVLRSVDGAAVTTIDGTGLNDSVVKCVNGEGLDTILDGFTITGGIGTFGAALGGGLFGGGMYNHAANPTVVNCIFTANNGARAGGGMFNHSSNPAIANCIFSHNAPTDWGGGMFNYSSNPSVSDCEFIQNIGTADGAGMFNDLSSPTVTNCTFSGNSVIGGAGGQGGGGMHNTANCNPIVTTCTFIGGMTRCCG